MNTFVYQIGENLYINLTNRCSNRCTFCVRNGKSTYEGYPLWLDREPTAAEVISLLKEPERFGEIVFCGFGEPTYKLAELLEICGHVHKTGGRTRLNTNGHGNAINGRDIAPELKGKLDGVNISLNAPDPARYGELCRPLIENGWEEVINFARSCRKNGVNCWFSVVDHIGETAVGRCREIAEEIGIPLRVREYIG